MRIFALVLLMMLSCLARAGGSNCVLNGATQQADLKLASQSNSIGGQRSQIDGSQIKISIATGGGLFGPAKDTFKVGQRVPVVITMTNTGSLPVYVCESGTLYQDRPQLLKDGRPVGYVSFKQAMMQSAERDKTCDKESLPEQMLLRPDEPTVVDWFILAEGATSLFDNAWYQPLQPGKYTLSNQRRLSCCDGPLIDTNTINFVVVP